MDIHTGLTNAAWMATGLPGLPGYCMGGRCCWDAD